LTVPENQLIALLPHSEQLHLLGLCEPVDWVLADVIGERGAATLHVYFPVGGFVSLVSTVDDHPGVEVGMVGQEGMLGVQLALGVAEQPLHTVVQGPGKALRLGAAVFLNELAASQAMRQALGAYLAVLMQQLANSAACQRFHQLEARLARWLLMTQDRTHADEFHVTHEFLAYMLGVRRVGVTQAAGALQRKGLLAYHRGVVRVCNRSGLEASACSCYADDQRIYRAGLGREPAGR
jgi:CRP-like cAMP-binding protein